MTSDRITMATPPLRLEYLDPCHLDAHPLNWKLHPAEQLDAVEQLTNTVGWAGALLFNERTGRLLDGHGRRERFKGKGPVPVLVGRWSEEEEREILRYLDPTGWMAKTDGRALGLLDAAPRLDAALSSPALAQLAQAVRESAELLADAPSVDQVEPDPATRPTRRPRAGDVPDAIWPTNNAWGVPVLDLALQADAVEFPVTVWGSQGQSKPMRGTWVFYAPDESFDHVWANPAKLLPSGAPCYVEPNWSTADQTPFAVALWSLYRRRWISRYLQSQGRRVFVDLNVHHGLLEPHEATAGAIPAFLGVPRGWKSYATRAHANRPEMLDAEYAAACSHADGNTVLFLVYGGGARVEQLARERGWVWVPERAAIAHGKAGASAVEPASEPAGVEA